MTAGRDELLALADRCEQATGADRELDAAIHGATGDDFRRYQIERLGAFGPAYTASLDAAMMLVPEGWFTTIIRDPAGTSYAGVAGHPDSCRPPCATPALALTAAALRARAVTPVQGEGE